MVTLPHVNEAPHATLSARTIPQFLARRVPMYGVLSTTTKTLLKMPTHLPQVHSTDMSRLTEFNAAFPPPSLSFLNGTLGDGLPVRPSNLAVEHPRRISLPGPERPGVIFRAWREKSKL